MFEGILGQPKEMRTQLHFRDDGTFRFRRLQIEDTFLVEKDNKSEIIKGWKHFFKNQFPFAGYKNIKADQVTMSFDRDIILDPYKLIENDPDSPEKKTTKKNKLDNKTGSQLTPARAWLSEVGEARRLKILAKRDKGTNYNKIVIFLGVALILELLIIGIQAASGAL